MQRLAIDWLLALVLFASNALGAAERGPLLSLDGERTTALELSRLAHSNEVGTLLRIDGLHDAEGAPMTLALEVGRLFAPGYKLYVDGREMPSGAPERLVSLHGTVEQRPGSSVAISLDAATGGWSGTLVIAGDVYDLSLAPGVATGGLASTLTVRRVDLGDLRPALVNDVLEGERPETAALKRSGSKRVIPAPGGRYGATVAIESDYEFFQGRQTVQAAETYIHDILAAVSELYERQLGVPLSIASISLYSDASDPWEAPNPHTGERADVLCEFASFWTAHRPVRDFPRNAALFFTGKGSSEISGQAWLSSLCSYNARPSACPFGGYGIVVSGRFVQRDALVAAHELGHVFGSPHTHCYRPEIDQCYASERGCFAGSVLEPPEGGSVMSYCTNSSLSLGEPDRFGDRSERVIGVMRRLVDSVGPSCLGRIGDPYELAAQAGPGSATLTWTDPFGNETGWLVEQIVKGKFKQIKSLPANNTTVTITKLAPGSTASFRVRAKIKKDVSDYSAVVEVVVE